MRRRRRRRNINCSICIILYIYKCTHMRTRSCACVCRQSLSVTGSRSNNQSPNAKSSKQLTSPWSWNVAFNSTAFSLAAYFPAATPMKPQVPTKPSPLPTEPMFRAVAWAASMSSTSQPAASPKVKRLFSSAWVWASCGHFLAQEWLLLGEAEKLGNP